MVVSPTVSSLSFTSLYIIDIDICTCIESDTPVAEAKPDEKVSGGYGGEPHVVEAYICIFI